MLSMSAGIRELNLTKLTQMPDADKATTTRAVQKSERANRKIKPP